MPIIAETKLPQISFYNVFKTINDIIDYIDENKNLSVGNVYSAIYHSLDGCNMDYNSNSNLLSVKKLLLVYDILNSCEETIRNSQISIFTSSSGNPTILDNVKFLNLNKDLIAKIKSLKLTIIHSQEIK